MSLSFTPLTQLAQLLTDAGVSASTNPEDVTLPGAWVTVEGIRQLTMDGALQLECVVYLVSGDTDHLRAYEALAELYNTIVPSSLVPDGVVVPQGVVMPGNSTAMPALRVPVNLI